MINKQSQQDFHAAQDAAFGHFVGWKQDDVFSYTFEIFFHPFVGELIQQLNQKSLAGLLDSKYHQDLTDTFFNSVYKEIPASIANIESFPKEIDLRSGGSYANYNWELLFHVPLTIAVHLSKNQRFAEAQRWFHYIFDPTSTDISIPTPQRFWKFLAFRNAGDVMQVEELLRILSNNDPKQEKLRNSILQGYEASKNKPFQPHAIARTRQIAYQYSVVMKYLDNLIAWGDSLFRQDTIESINEATQIYVLAANLLGKRPQKIPSPSNPNPQNFAQLKAKGLNVTGNALVELEGKFPFNLGIPQSKVTDPNAATPLFGIGRTLYFCIPKNEKMLGYWDTVGDRLFKIRHCMNIEGIVRQLALFDPPIDPGMLVKAAAAGIDIGSIVSGLNQPVSPVRAILFIQKALELCGEVRSLGGALLSAIEKGEGERLALLRQSHEIKIQQIQQDVRFLQWKQAQEASESLLRSRSSALERYSYYQRLLGLTPDKNAVPDTFTFDRSTSDAPPQLTEENFDQAYAVLISNYDKTVVSQDYSSLELRDEGKLKLHAGEYDDLNEHSERALAAKISAAATEVITAGLSLIPTFHLKASFWGVGSDARIGGGDPISSSGRAVSSGISILSQIDEKKGQNSSKKASYELRADERIFQYKLASRELMQIGKQIISSLITEQVTHHEYHNTKELIKNSQEVDRFLQDKFTNKELYAWMQGEISRLYYEYYRFAFDTARKAEQTMKRELMRPEVDATTYIKFNYWDAGRKGLLSGEALYLDLKRMEMAYHENNKREYELTKHISLLQMSPLALLQLRTTGNCTVSLPEEIFDMDGPGHYFRRIKTVAVSIPCVTGPYTSINCTLTLLKSSIRTKPLLGDGYQRRDSEDDRFNDSFGSLQTIVTSSGQNDSGLFETNLRDERYLPFEGAGAISQWQLTLPANPSKEQPCQFDYQTISDAILHIRYTAREAGGSLKTESITNLQTYINEAQNAGSVRLFSIRHEFPTEWAKLQNTQIGAATPAAELTLALRPEHYPFWSQSNLEAIKRADLFVKTNKSLEVSYQPNGAGVSDSLVKDDVSLGNLWVGKLTNKPDSTPIEKFTVYLKFQSTADLRSTEDIWLTINWGKRSG